MYHNRQARAPLQLNLVPTSIALRPVAIVKIAELTQEMLNYLLIINTRLATPMIQPASRAA